MTALGRVGRMEELSKKGKKRERTHGHEQKCGNCGRRKEDGGGRSHGDINGDEK